MEQSIFLVDCIHWLIEELRLSPAQARLNIKNGTIEFKESEHLSKTCTVNLEDVLEIREGQKTDTWLNSKSNKNVQEKIDELIKDENLFPYSVFCKSASGLLPGITYDFFISELDKNQFVKKLQELLNDLREIDADRLRQFNDTPDDKNALWDVFRKCLIPGQDKINIQGLQQFFLNEQKNQKSLSDCEKLICHFGTENTMNFNEFNRLFNHDTEFSLFKDISQDMTQPMSHYFIASSHNSYLIGNQLTSKSSYEMYRNILLDGCRCIEIDILDPNDGNNLRVSHRLTATTSILLREVLQVIKDVGFKNSKYPIIISIENRLNGKYYKRLAKTLYEVLGDLLYIEDVEESETQFPNLNSMMGRVFLKGKRVDEENVLQKRKKAQKQSTTDDWPWLTKHDTLGDFPMDDKDDESDYSDDDSENDSEDESEANMSVDEEVHDNKASTQDDWFWCNTSTYENDDYKGPTLSQMFNYFQTKTFTNFEDCRNFKFYHMFSRKETKSKELFGKDNNLYREFTTTNMVRVYPRGRRIDSSNYQPLRHWNAGTQMVALNYQRCSLEMLINWTQFKLNGKCGYVLKPNYLRDNMMSRQDITTQPQLTEIILKIQILAGKFQELPIDAELSVVTRVYSPDPNHTRRINYWKEPKSTKSIKDNCHNPVWIDKDNNHTFEYTLSHPELSFVMFSLKNGERIFIGHHMFAFQSMQQGYRWIDLYDNAMKPIPLAKIYVHINFETRRKKAKIEKK